MNPDPGNATDLFALVVWGGIALAWLAVSLLVLRALWRGTLRGLAAFPLWLAAVLLVAVASAPLWLYLGGVLARRRSGLDREYRARGGDGGRGDDPGRRDPGRAGHRADPGHDLRGAWIWHAARRGVAGMRAEPGPLKAPAGASAGALAGGRFRGAPA
ncbi:hypothetical protein [Pseudogemmobacter sonorensis]|uniref:hypothetical protein n=1 Tax=Pseudogemmobacter sonorensis TaxID=2989681 RepID=UPI0036958DEA